MVEPEVIESRIRDNIEGVSIVEIRDLTGSKDHYEATVVASAFATVSRVKQHQLVYGALGELMAGLSAVAAKTANRQRTRNGMKRSKEPAPGFGRLFRLGCRRCDGCRHAFQPGAKD